MDNLLQKLAAINDRWKDIAQQITDPSVIADMQRYVKLNKEYKDLEPHTKAFAAYKLVLDNIRNSKAILESEEDPEFLEMAQTELRELEEKKDRMQEKIKLLLIPKDPTDQKNVIIEIRAGTGGDEASIFAGDLFRMYTRYAEKHRWKLEIINSNEGSSGGFKEISFGVSGEDIFGTMKFESGVHRVQRVPATESQGRVHTSAATVAVLPEADEVDVDLNMEDVKVDTFRASGAGGQHVNKTESAVRLTHLPSGMVVECQDGRSQHKNKDKAIQVLRSRLYEAELQKQQQERAQQRRSQISSGDRSAKVRTYNYPQGRVTDHRINLTLYTLGSVMDGDLEDMLEALKVAENAEKLSEGQ